MKLSFHGAAREVTGSCHLIEVGNIKILIDCGMYQGGGGLAEENLKPFGLLGNLIVVTILSAQAIFVFKNIKTIIEKMRPTIIFFMNYSLQVASCKIYCNYNF